MKNLRHLAVGVFFALLPAFLVGLLVLSASSASAGVLNFKMTAPRTTLNIGEIVTVTVSAWINDSAASPNNGLDTWQLDLSVNNTGILGITETEGTANISLLAPDPDPMWSGWNAATVNSPITGEVCGVVVTQLIWGNPSYIGVGGYSDIFTFNIEALAAGVAAYTICDDGGGLFYGALVDGTEYEFDNIIFDAQNSDNVFTVISVPEPASLTIFAFAGILAALRKK
ncbi:MAG: hypothetical protein PHP01_04905 [Phycisphaerae bacterium]|nr:hypothetical protein [Phycisphaerae bacterium]